MVGNPWPKPDVIMVDGANKEMSCGVRQSVLDFFLPTLADRPKPPQKLADQSRKSRKDRTLASKFTATNLWPRRTECSQIPMVRPLLVKERAESGFNASRTVILTSKTSMVFGGTCSA
ncbi:hypothetical protein TNCV_1202341 [Trichonephila clavipes]|nr:hypothetical protein TNCV_1202341 [Trichonephila clavipes]